MDYLNARIRAWRSQLLKKEVYDGLIAEDTLEGLIERLRVTSYARDIEVTRSRLGDKDESEILEGGLKGNLERVFGGLWKDAPPMARELLRVILSSWEVYNIKTVLRGGDKGPPPEEVFSLLLPCGSLDVQALKELNQARDVKSVASLLDTWGSPYTRPIKDNLSRYVKDKELMPIELALDRFLYSNALEMLDGDDLDIRMVRNLIRDRIDLANSLTPLKLAGEKGVVAESYFIQGGKRLTEDGFLLLSREEKVEGLLEGLASMLKDGAWSGVVKSIEPEDAFLLEERLGDLIQKEFCRMAIVEPLTIALSICFIYKKVREVKNLRLIAKGKAHRIPTFEIRRLII
ncbi:MAG: V-type ATPase subunit [Deltaproteobacteria bacterium]|nr:V-type ATPase subunit [Deltaproteobacteria bacterium]